MPALPRMRMTVEEYLAFERASDERHEFIDGEIYLMTGGTGKHSLIAVGAASHLFAQLGDGRCRVFQSNMRVKINQRDYTYPDVSVVCGALQYEDDVEDTLLNPTLVIEVLSPSTEQYDRGKKFHLYRTLKSLQEYILISQDTYRIERFMRQGDSNWLYSEAVGSEASLELQSIGCVLTLADVYRQVTFDKPET